MPQSVVRLRRINPATCWSTNFSERPREIFVDRVDPHVTLWKRISERHPCQQSHERPAPTSGDLSPKRVSANRPVKRGLIRRGKARYGRHGDAPQHNATQAASRWDGGDPDQIAAVLRVPRLIVLLEPFSSPFGFASPWRRGCRGRSPRGQAADLAQR
jgi:hypothetical protein